jgi:5-methylcytosine-specific restriction endonuclease McrA
MQKSCSTCHVVKPLSDFHQRKDRPNGQSSCIACTREKKKARYHKDKEKLAIAWAQKYHGRSPEEKAEYRRKVNETKRKYYRANTEKIKVQLQASRKRRDPEKMRATRRAWEEANREARTLYEREYVKKNREKSRAWKAAWKKRHPEKAKLGRRLHRRNLRRMGVVSKITMIQWNAMLEFYKHCCQICGLPANGEQLTADHIIPISKGGLHTWQNLQPAHKSCNSSKHNKLIAFPYPPHILHFRPKWSIYNIISIAKAS